MNNTPSSERTNGVIQRFFRQTVTPVRGPRGQPLLEIAALFIVVLAGNVTHFIGHIPPLAHLNVYLDPFHPPPVQEIVWLAPLGYGVWRFGARGALVVTAVTYAILTAGSIITAEPMKHVNHGLSILLAGTVVALFAVVNQRLQQQREGGIRQLERAREWLGALHTVTESVTGTVDKDQLLASALRRSLEVARLEGSGLVFLIDESRGVLELAAHVGLPQAFVEAEREVPLGECLCGLAAQSGETIYSPLNIEDPRHTRGGPGTPHGHIIVPLRAPNRAVGVMCLYLAPGSVVEDEALQALSAIGDQLGVAIDNLRLLESENQAHAEAQAAEAKFRRLFEQAVDAIVVFDTQNGRVLDFNATAMEVLGMSRAALAAASLEDLGPPEARREALRALHRIVRGGKYFQSGVRHTRGDGQQVWLEITAEAADYEGRLAAQTVIRDVTARMEAEQARAKRTAEMDTLSHLSTILISSSTLDELLERFLDVLTELTGFEVAAIYLAQPETQGLALIAHKGLPDASDLWSAVDELPLESSLLGRVLDGGKPAFFSDVTQESLARTIVVDKGILSGYVVPLSTRERTIGAVALADIRRHAEPPVPLELLDTIGSQLAMAIANAQLREDAQRAARRAAEHALVSEDARERLEDAYLDVTLSLVLLLEARDPYTRGHSDRVGIYARLIGREMGLASGSLAILERAAQLHDLGKIGISDTILHKPGPLDPTEWAEMHRHPARSVEMVRHLPFLEDALPAIRSHHERWDGAGYPDNLLGEEIPLGARILAVADAYDAMTTSRPYRPPFTHEEAVNILRQGAGAQWDPEVVTAFTKAAKSEPLDSYPVRLDTREGA